MHKLIDAIDIPDHRVSVGSLFITGVGYRVGTWDGHESRQMSPAAARRLARELEATPTAEELQPVIAALRTVSDRVDGLASDDVAGNA